MMAGAPLSSAEKLGEIRSNHDWPSELHIMTTIIVNCKTDSWKCKFYSNYNFLMSDELCIWDQCEQKNQCFTSIRQNLHIPLMVGSSF